MNNDAIPAVQYQQNAPAGFAPAGGAQPVNAVAPVVDSVPSGSPAVASQFNGGSDGIYYTPDHLTLMDLVEMAVGYAFIAAFALSAVFIFVGGMSFILSGGNDEKIKQSVNTIRYAIIGLIITILSFTFVQIVGRIFGLDFLSYLSLNKIRNSVEMVFQSGQTTQPTNFQIQGR